MASNETQVRLEGPSDRAEGTNSTIHAIKTDGGETPKWCAAYYVTRGLFQRRTRLWRQCSGCHQQAAASVAASSIASASIFDCWLSCWLYMTAALTLGLGAPRSANLS